MKIILFKKNNREIGRLLPDKRTLLVGRAPVCDLVLRKEDLKPIHFMIEWMGEGSFDPYQGIWSVVDISHSDSRVNKGAYSGEAFILTEAPLKINDFEVSMEEEKLAASPISKGVLQRSLDIENAGSSINKPDLDRVLELVTYNTEIDVVTSVNHFSKELLQKGIKIASLPKVAFSYSAQTSNVLTIENQGDENIVDLYNRADRIIEKFQNVNDSITVDEDDFYLLYSPENAYYIRWVNKYDVQPPASAWKKDPVVVTLIIVVIFMFLLGVGIKFIDKTVTTEIPKPQRVAKVEVIDFAQKPEEIQAPPIYENEVKKEEIKAPPVEKKVEELQAEAKPSDKPEDAKVKNSKAEDKNQAAAPKVTQQQGKRATFKNIDENMDLAQGLNQKAPITNVNKVGLLGKLGGAKKAGSGISADAVMATVKPTDSASGDTGKVQVLQPPTGKINLTNAGKSQAQDDEGEGLSGATTTLKMDNMAKGTKISGMASSKATGSIGNAAFGGNQKGGSDSIQSLGGSVSLETKAMEVQGGLTKEQVRQAIADNRRALRNCHEQFLTYKKDLGGRIVLRWKINGDGPVDTINAQVSTTSYPNFDSCILDVVKKITFPKAPNGNSTIVIYPFLFQPKK